MIGATVSLYAVDLPAALLRWRAGALDDLVRARPRGRLASHGTRTAGLAPLDGRALFEALVEDLAIAALHDAPFSALAEVVAHLARATKLRGLELSVLETAPLAYPAELRAEPARETTDGRAGLVIYLEGPGLRQAARATDELLASPRGNELARDLAEGLRPIFEGPVVVAQVV